MMSETAELNLSPALDPALDHNKYVSAIFEREMGVTLHNLLAGSPRDEAMRNLTKEATNLYAKRVVRELIQNAFDGSAGADEPRILLRLNLRQGAHGTLSVANNGQGFTSENVDAVVSPAMSNKTPGNFIGHKGLGFRSVELLSDNVQIFSMRGHGIASSPSFDGFRFRFALPEDERAWLDSQGEIRHADQIVGRVHRLQLPIALDKFDDDAASFARAGFATLVRLPLRNADAAARAAEELRMLFDEKAPITLFLDRLQSLTIERIDADGKSETRVLNRRAKPVVVGHRGRTLTLDEVVVDRHRFLLGRMDVDDSAFRASVARSVQQRHLVERWLEWKGVPQVSVAFPLSSDARAGSYFAFLPMERPAPFNGCIDAPFYPDADRRDLDLSVSLNAFLLDQAAELCLAIAGTLADAGETAPEFVGAAVDALSWTNERDRVFEACTRLDVDVGSLMLPSMRRPGTSDRWARLDKIYNWDDQRYRILHRNWLVRVCDLPMLPRKLGPSRMQALDAFVNDTDFPLTAPSETWAKWVPQLAADLARRRKLVRRDWEDFYADLASSPAVLSYLRGTEIFRLADGSCGRANSQDTSEESELFINPVPEQLQRRRKRLSGTALFPPDSIAKRMIFADPDLNWPPAVTNAFFEAQLATEYSLPRVLSKMGKLLGKRPRQASVIAALGWAFAAYKSLKSVEMEQALRTANLSIPLAGNTRRSASSVYFGAGWRDTKGDLLSEFLEAAPEEARSLRHLREGLLTSWEAWPFKEKGTSAEWVHFMRLLGVRDGLVAVRHASVAKPMYEWMRFRSSDEGPLSIETAIGTWWRQAVRKANPADGFRYQSGSYQTGETLYSFPGQAEHPSMSPAARFLYARLIVLALGDLPPSFLVTVLHRTGGNADSVSLESPLAAFLRRAEWLPIGGADEVAWRRPDQCWYAPRSEQLPRFVAKMARSIRDIFDGSQSAREFASRNLGLRLWSDPTSAISRFEDLGTALEGGIAESDQDTFRKVYREAWEDWHVSNPRPVFPMQMTLAVQSFGRTVPLTISATRVHPAIYVADGSDPMREQLLSALGHMVLTVPAGVAEDVARTLAATLGGEFLLLPDADLVIRADGQVIVPSEAVAPLVTPGLEWLAEIAVLVLEFNEGLSNRNTARSRQALYNDFRRLRLATAARITVEVDGLEGPLPTVLDGVLAVPDADFPTLVVQHDFPTLDWSLLARISRALPVALGRPSLGMPFRVAFLEIDRIQRGRPGTIEKPGDEDVALALGHPLIRVQEIYRSLRSTGRRLYDWLAPAAQAIFGDVAANALLDREYLLLEDEEVVSLLAAHGATPDVARKVVVVCRDADGLDDVRRSLGISLVAFNHALVTLGRTPLRFEQRLRTAFLKHKEATRNDLERKVRDAFMDIFFNGGDLSRYNELRRLDWVSFDPDWPDQLDELSDDIIDSWFARLASETLPVASAVPVLPLDDVRQQNRIVVLSEVEQLRPIVTAWVDKEQARHLPSAWKLTSELLTRELMGSGVLDFRVLEKHEVPAAFARAKLWPSGMPASSILSDLGLSDDDLEVKAKEDEKLRQEDLKAKRSITFGSISVDGGGESPLDQVANVLDAALSSKAFLQRSGKSVLRPFTAGSSGGGRQRGKGGRGREPDYLSEEQRTLLGFAGELAAYHYLKKNVRNFLDAYWISSMGRRYLTLEATDDVDGYDFHVRRSRGPDLFFEVKAHTGDPGYVDLEPSQVAAGMAMSDEKNGIWSILYIPYVRNLDLITVHELENPFSDAARSLYRQVGRQAMRLELRRI
jgi:hypothetical protein